MLTRQVYGNVRTAVVSGITASREEEARQGIGESVEKFIVCLVTLILWILCHFAHD